MTSKSYDRRMDAHGLNIMQRIFDELAIDRGTSVDELVQRTRFAKASIASAIKRLQLQRAVLPASCVDGIWLYRRRADAIRPADRRGGIRRQMAQGIAA